MNRPALAPGLLAAALVACGDGSGSAPQPRVILSPVLDSLYVGDTLLTHSAAFITADGDTLLGFPGTWTTSDTTVVKVLGSGSVVHTVGVGPGFAIITASHEGADASGLVVVTRKLDLALLLDTIFLMPQDTFFIPVEVRVKSGATPTVWFSAPTNALFQIDSAAGRITATAAGNPIAFVAHAASGADTVADTGAVEVVLLGDTTGGKAFFTILGTAIRRARASVRGVNYKRQGDSLTFRLNASLAVGGVNVENVVLTVRTPVTVPFSFVVDSISPEEAFDAGNNFVCRPARPWGLWSLRASTATITALSRPGGVLRIHRVTPVSNGQAISGSFTFLAQRTDMYDEPLGVLPVRGVFVAPLVADNRPCGS
ncbi:MAG: hypothetical protein HYS40_03500 [Gemmatimonadetes bacterium]|nr:hypothetical protein [Gemmatimonadota bacterium]